MAQRGGYSFGSEAHTAEEFEQYENVINNGEARAQICFVIDTSSSMNIVINDKSETKEVRGTGQDKDGNYVVRVVPAYDGVTLVTRMEKLRTVFSEMLKKMRSNDILARSAVVCIVTFDLFADCRLNFTDLGKISPNISSRIGIGGDSTNVSKGIWMALDRLDHQREMNSNAGNDSFNPVLILMSDGQATDGRDAEIARQEVRRRSEEEKLSVIPIGIGRGIDERWLRGLSHDGRVYHMNTDREFDEVFEEITKRIHEFEPVIVMDASRNNLANDAPDGVASTRYGQDYESFLENFMNM